MNARLCITWLALVALGAAAAGPAPKTYTPEIHGMLTSGRQPIASNVCLRKSDSEIRSCGYADASGHFFIPAVGPLYPVQPASDDDVASKPLTYWLETGNVMRPQKLSPIEIVTTPYDAIDVDCDISEPSRTDPTFRACEIRASRQLVDHKPRDDTRYRMARPAPGAQE